MSNLAVIDFQHKSRQPFMREIANAISDFYGVDSKSLCAGGRRVQAYPRQIGFYLCRILTDYSYPEIGRFFGRDHTTVMFGVRAIRTRLLSDPITVREIEILMEKLKT